LSPAPDADAPDRLRPGDLPAVLAIYEEAFPSSERVPSPVLAEGFGGNREGLVLRTAGRVVAFASLIALAPDARFLEYLAVSSEARGGGHGGRLLQHLRVQGGAVLLEVEDPAEPGISSDESAARERRIAFYRAHGGRPAPFGLSYRPPSFDGSPPARMVLYAVGDTAWWTLSDVLDRLATASSITYATAVSTRPPS
jgi:ribosomal protein S18 acetylase RimI-like enzyme